MKFVVDKEVLIDKLSSLIIVCGKKNTINPILQNIKIEAKNGQVVFTATDLDTIIQNTLNILVDRQGITTVSAQMLFEIVKKMNDGSQISIEYKDEDNVLLVSSGRSKFKLPCLSAEEYPYFEELEADFEFSINTQDFAKMIDKTRFAISNDESRYYLTGLFLHSKCINDEYFYCGATTDGHKLAFVRVPQSDKNIIFNGIIIPKKTLGEIRKLLETKDEEIMISFSQTKIKITTKETTLISKLINAEFPEYTKVIPQNNRFEAIIDKKEFSGALNRVSTIAEEKTKGVCFHFTNDSLKLIANNAGDTGYGDEEIKAQYNGEDLQIGFNSRYMLEIVSQIESDCISIKIDNPNVPALIRGTEENNQLFVLMPMKV